MVLGDGVEDSITIYPLQTDYDYEYVFSNLGSKSLTAQLTNVLGESVTLNLTLNLIWPIMEVDMVVSIFGLFAVAVSIHFLCEFREV